ncbi:MAG TPA: cytochrome c oxidase assembly protein [Terriglobales bacterium]
MPSVAQAVLRSWSIPPVATFALVLTALTYLRGAWLLRRAGYPYLPAWRMASFALGLFALWFALASPLDTFSPFVLTAHMLQHMMLMMVAPPLILLGEPLIPIVRGMPRFAAREFAGPILNWRIAERMGFALTNPVVALVLMGIVMFAWHVPGPYELAVRSSAWHQLEHACFFFASIIFWWPVVDPWPSRAQWPRWAMVPYLVIADLENTALSAILVFSDKILYPSYAAGPSLFGFTPQEDQAAAGAIMWVVGSLAFIVPAILIAIECLSRRRAEVQVSVSTRRKGSAEDARSHPRAKKLFADRLNSRAFEAASCVTLFVITAAAFVVLSSHASDDDDQVLRLSLQEGPFAISVYGPSGELVPGPANFGVLVQDRNSRAVLLDSEVHFILRDPAGKDLPVTVPASRGDENKLLLAADLDLDTPGARIVDVTVQNANRNAIVSMPLEVVTATESGFQLRWSYVVMVTVSVLLCSVYFWRHRTTKPAGLPAPVA